MLVILLVLVILGYFTLLERKIIGYTQYRKGPNKSVIIGLVQPLVDGFKLFIKGFKIGVIGGFISFYLIPILGLRVIIIVWAIFRVFLGCQTHIHIYWLCLFLAAMTRILIFVRGLISSGKYRVIGSVRALAQRLSYEGSLFFICLSVILISIRTIDLSIFVSLLIICQLIVVIIRVIIECNRSPIDFVEGESEIVSGLTTEIGGGRFRFLFLIEYGIMSFYSIFIIFLALGSYWYMEILIILGMLVIGVINWLRITLPRRRYDIRLIWGWKFILVVRFRLIIISLGVIVWFCFIARWHGAYWC